VCVLWLFIEAAWDNGLCGESNTRAQSFVAPTEMERKIAQPNAMRDKSLLVPRVVKTTLVEQKQILEWGREKSDILADRLTPIQQLDAAQGKAAEAPRCAPAWERKQALALEHEQECYTAEVLARALTASLREEIDALRSATEAARIKQKQALDQERDRADALARELTSLSVGLDKARIVGSEGVQADEAEIEQRQALDQERDRADRLEQSLAAAKRDVETQTALAAKANEEASEQKQAAESAAAELQKSLQQEGQRAERLERDLAAARRDVETQTALVAKASEEASEQKQAAESAAAELQRSLQQERERAERLGRDLAAAKRDVETQTALVAKANEEASQRKQVAESGTVKLQKSLQEERERAGRLEQDLAAARRDVETQTALAAKANEDATQRKQVAENGSAELKRSLQNEHDRAEALAQDLSLARAQIYAYEAQARKASDQGADLKQAAASGAAELRKSLQQERERAERLEQDLAAAPRNVETQTAPAAKAGADAARLKLVADDSSAELLRSLQQERDSAARPERELPSARTPKHAPTASAVVAAGQVTQDKQVRPDATKQAAADQAAVAKARGEAQPTPEDAAEVARLVARASVLLGQGDIGSARIVLERADERGSAQASFALAETYDPLILRKWGAYGTRGDATKARDLYAKAQAGGIKEAKERFDALRR
jgi:hypothetical protein